MCSFPSPRPLSHFWTDMRFGSIPACRFGVYLVSQKHLQARRLRGPGLARSGCVLGLGRDVFFGGRSRERTVLDWFCSESTKHISRFDYRSRIESRRHPQQWRIGRRPETLFLAYVYGRDTWHGLRKSCWNRLPTNGGYWTRPEAESYVCMYVMM